MPWISKIEPSRDREENIRDCFGDQTVNFEYPNNAMDDVSGIADKSNKFANFLTVSQKYGLTCVYIFHIVYPTRKNWQMILSQTKIFNFFPASVQASSVIKLLSSFASRYKNTYISNRNLWISQLYYEISNSRQKNCLTIDTRDVNELGRAKFRTKAESGIEQICYYNRNRKDTCFNCFLAVRKQTSSPFEITFSIVKVTDNANRQNVIYSEISDELSDFKNDNVQRTTQRVSENDSVRGKK